MNSLVVLVAITIAFAFLTWSLRINKQTLPFLAGLLFLFYYTFMGAWVFTIDNLFISDGKKWGIHYYYLFDKMFKVNLDQSYLNSLLLYAAFSFTVLLLIIIMKRIRTKTATVARPVRLVLHPLRLALISVIAIASSLYIVKEEIYFSFHTNTGSLYQILRSSPNRLFTLHQLLNQVSVFSIVLAFVLTFNKKSLSEITLKYHKFNFLIYLVLGFVIIVTGLMGNKRDLLFSLLFTFLLLFLVSEKVILKKVLLTLIILCIPLLMTDTIRSFSLNLSQDNLEVKNISRESENFFSIAGSILFSTEMFSPQFSMYGVLDHHIEPSANTSLVALAASFVPRALWPNRPDGIYTYYRDQLHLSTNQGFTIHHATAGYLNYGIAGVLISGIVFGVFWLLSYRYYINGIRFQNRFLSLMRYCFFLGFSAGVPILLRSGIEAYKPLLMECILLPACIMFIATVKNGGADSTS